MILPLLLGCSGLFVNTAPKIKVFNGDPVRHLLGIPLFELHLTVTPGEEQPLVLELEDAERDALTVWFPWQPEGLDFPREATQGVWHVPTDPTVSVGWLTIIVLDDDPRDPRSTEYDVSVDGLMLDTAVDTATDTGR